MDCKKINSIAALATSDGFSVKVRLSRNASIFTAELQVLKIAFNDMKNIVMGIVLSYSLFFSLIATEMQMGIAF